MPKFFAFLLALTLWGNLAGAELRELASQGGLSAWVEKDSRASSNRRIRVHSASEAGFSNANALGKLVTAVAAVLAAEQGGRPLQSVQIAGYHGENQVLWAEALLEERWAVKERFNLIEAKEKLAFLPNSFSGLLTLAFNQTKQREAVGKPLPDYDAALKAKALELFDKALSDYAREIGKFEPGPGAFDKLNQMTTLFHTALDSLEVPRRTEVGNVRDAEARKRSDDLLAAAKRQVEQFNPPGWEDILAIDHGHTNLVEALRRHGFTASAANLTKAINARATALFMSSNRLDQFQGSLSEFKVSHQAVDDLNEVGLTLAAYAERFPVLTNYVETIQRQMGDTLQAYFEITAEAIGTAGKTVDDIAALFAEGEQEAEWFENWGSPDLAELVRIEVEDRAGTIAEDTYAAFAKELAALPPTSENVRSLQARLSYLEAQQETLAALEPHVVAARKRLEALRYEADMAIYQSLALKRETKRTTVNVGGHLVSIADFVRNLRAAGHAVKAAAAPFQGSGAQEVLAHLGWQTPSTALNSLTVTTSEGITIGFEISPEAEAGDYFVPDLIRQASDVEPLYPSEWVALMLKLGAVVPTGTPDRNKVTDSDRFASDPNDPKRVVPDGTFDEELNTDVAIAASLAAIEENPDEPRFRFHLGRALYLAGEKEEAKEFLTSAYEDGYAAAAHHLGNMLIAPMLDTKVTNPNVPMRDLRRAREHYLKAMELGYESSKGQLAMVDGMMALNIPPFDANTFKMAKFLKLCYEGNVDILPEGDEQAHNEGKYYLLGLRAAAAEEDSAFGSSELSKNIFAYAPAYLRRMKSDLEAAGNDPLKALGAMQHSVEVFADVKNFADIFRVMAQSEQMGKLVEGGREDGQVLMMYLKSDPEEVTRFFEHVLAYFKKYHRIDSKTP